jgi:hypothetical protein
MFFAQTFSRYVLVAGYCVNTSAYAANCVNKDRPWMKCNGRCQLCKKLDQQDNNQDKQTPERKSENSGNETLYSNHTFIGATTSHVVAIVRRFPAMTALNPVRMPRKHFHPPGDHLA